MPLKQKYWLIVGIGDWLVYACSEQLGPNCKEKKESYNSNAQIMQDVMRGINVVITDDLCFLCKLIKIIIIYTCSCKLNIIILHVILWIYYCSIKNHQGSILMCLCCNNYFVGMSQWYLIYTECEESLQILRLVLSTVWCPIYCRYK